MSVPIIRPEAEEDWAQALTFRQEQFVREYEALGFKHKEKAGLIAGYAPGGGAQVTKIPRVAQAIEDRHNAYLRSRHLGRDRILEELAMVAGFDLGDILTRGVLDTKKLKGKATRAIASITKTDKGTTVKTHDKLAALRLLMQHLGMIQEGQVNLQVNLDFGERMAARRAKVIDQTS